MKVSETIKGIDLSVPLPENITFTCQCVEEKFAPSKNSGSMVITRTFQILEPDEIQIGDQTFFAAGTEIMQYVTSKVMKNAVWDDRGTKKAMGRLVEDYKKFGVTFGDDEEIDENNPPLIAKGKVVDLLVKNGSFVFSEPPTAEDLAQGKKQGKPKLRPDGSEQHGYNKQVGTIYGLNKDVKAINF